VTCAVTSCFPTVSNSIHKVVSWPDRNNHCGWGLGAISISPQSWCDFVHVRGPLQAYWLTSIPSHQAVIALANRLRLDTIGGGGGGVRGSAGEHGIRRDEMKPGSMTDNQSSPL